jgi:putative hemolysin
MPLFNRGAYRVRIAETVDDVTAAQRLRYLSFIRDTGAAPRDDRLDADGFDADCAHVLIELEKDDTLVCCFRMMTLENGHEVARSYSAQYYDLGALESFPARMVEMGRFCVHPDHRNPHVLRIAWQAMTRYVDDHGIELLFGCSSFEGADAEAHADALALLHERHLAPRRWLPQPKAPDIFSFAALLRHAPDPKAAMMRMPPLLRGYLSLGGWVSDHAVIDRDMNTLHVFTGVEMKRVPSRVAKLLRK